jgi:hypothetical protein
MITMRFLWLLLTVLCISTSFAQKRGEPQLDDLKAEIKKAKDGDIAAMLVVADRCRGSLFAGDLVRDYKQAKKWYTEAVEKEPQNKEANLGLFKVYTIGGYGVDKNDEIAKKHFRTAIEAYGGHLVMNFADNLNLDLMNFYSSLEKAQVGSIEDMVLLARMYFHYEISLVEATAWAEKAKAKGDKDAAYLLDYWNYLKNKTNDENFLYSIQQGHTALGSSMAKLGMLTTARNKNKITPENIENYEKEFTKNPVIEFKIKGLALLSHYIEGKKQFTLLRHLHEIIPTDKIESFFCQEPLALLADFDTKTKTLKDLFVVAAKHQDMRYLAYSVEEYDKNFEGKIDNLIKIQQNINTPQHNLLFSAENMAAYQAELAQKAVEVVQAANNINKFVSLKRLAEVDKWLVSLAGSLQPAMAKKMTELGVTNENLSFFYEKSLMDEKTFKSLEEGKRYYYHIQSSELDNENRQKLLGLFKNKLLSDVFGSNRDVETIEKMRVAANTQGWLLPEVQNRYLSLVNENSEWFTGIVDRNEIRYHFTVSKDNEAKTQDRYKVDIRGVKNEEAHLVYSGQVAVQDLREKSKEVRCKVFFVVNENGSNWRVSGNDFLETSLLQGEEYLKYKPQGKMLNCLADDSHTTPKDDIAKTMTAYDFSLQNAVKTSLKVMILEFNKALLPL